MTTAPMRPSRPAGFSLARGTIRIALALGSRLVLFALLQALVAGLLFLAGETAAWSSSVAWWPVTATIANLAGIALLRAFLRAEGKTYRGLWHIERTTFIKDLATTFGLLLIGGALAMGPNFGLATLLWDDPQLALDTFIQPLPLVAAVFALIGFPLSIALSELPTYYGYARPRLERSGMAPMSAIVLTGTMHALQHVTLPLVFDWRFSLWRALMFLPFALFVAAALRWRPRLLPYLMIAHGLLDLSVAVMVLQAAF